jgi:hypothetical protein
MHAFSFLTVYRILSFPAFSPRCHTTVPPLGTMHSPKHAMKGRSAIQVPNVTDAVIAALAVASSCVPAHAVMLSMATTHHMKLRPVQFARVEHMPCFMSRLVSVCYGFTDRFGACVHGACDKSLGMGNPCLPSDYRRSQYVALNWAKWPLFIGALRVARSALWLEADVVILRNPWEVLLADAQAHATVHHAVRYQYESPPCTVRALVQSPAVECVKSNWPAPHPEELNCGQLLLNSLDFALEVWASRPAVFKNGATSQQGYANQIKANYSHSGMPLGFFNLCWKAHRYAAIVAPCELATYHATCEMVAKSKRASMNSSVAHVARLNCPPSLPSTLSAAQLHAFGAREHQPTRSTAITVAS